MKETKSILFILPTLNAGGTENYTLRFIKYFKDVFHFTVISLNPSKGDLHDGFASAGAKIIYQSTGYLNPLKGIKLYNIIKSHQIDVVCAFNGNFAGWPLFIARLAGVNNRIVFYRRSTPAFKLTFINRIYHKFSGILVRMFAVHILSNSELAFKNFHPKKFRSDKRFRVIYNGVSKATIDSVESKMFYRSKYGIGSNTFVIGHVGRYDKAKNHETIFKVAQNLTKRYSYLYFVFCGKDTDSDKFIHDLDRYGIKDRVIYLGLKDEVGEVLKTFDMFLFPSITEGQPNALIEAMLVGLPFIASNIESIKEIVPENYWEFLVDPLDTHQIEFQIEKRINSDNNSIDYQLINYANTVFNSSDRFDELKTVLIE